MESTSANSLRIPLRGAKMDLGLQTSNHGMETGRD
jgi:hypothetical protein